MKKKYLTPALQITEISCMPMMTTSLGVNSGTSVNQQYGKDRKSDWDEEAEDESSLWDDWSGK